MRSSVVRAIGNRRYYLIAICIVLIPLPRIGLFNPLDQNPDTYYHYSNATGYLASFWNLGKIGIVTVGPVTPGLIALTRLALDPGSDIRSAEVLVSFLTIGLLALVWIESLVLLCSPPRDGGRRRRFRSCSGCSSIGGPWISGP